MVLCSEKSGDLMANYLPTRVWRRLPSELTPPVKWSPRAEGPNLCSISQELHLAHKKPEYEHGFIPSLLVKKMHQHHPHTCRLTPCFRRNFALFRDSSQIRACCSIVQMNGKNNYAARGKPLWRHNALCDVISEVTTKQTSAPLVTDATTMHVTVVKSITENRAVSLLVFYHNQVIRVCRPGRLHRGQIRAMYWIKSMTKMHTAIYASDGRNKGLSSRPMVNVTYSHQCTKIDNVVDSL